MARQPADVQIRFKNTAVSSTAASGIKVSHPILLIDGINLTTSPTNLSAFETDLTTGDDKHNPKVRDIIKVFSNDLGYTPILVQFGNTTGKSTQDNAKIFSALLTFLASTNMLQWDNASAEKYQIIGFSQGGVIGRYGAYLYDKSRGTLPGIRQLLTFDSPHQGAVLPRGLLPTINFFASQSDDAQTYSDLLRSAGVNDLVIYDTKSADFAPSLSSDRWLFGEYRKAANYTGFSTVMLSEGLLQGALNQGVNTKYYQLDYSVQSLGVTLGSATSEIDYSNTPTGQIARNHTDKTTVSVGDWYLDYANTTVSTTSVTKTMNGESEWDLVQGSTYPFPNKMYSLFSSAFANAMDGIDFTSAGFNTQTLTTPSTTFIPTVSALDMQCNGDIAVRGGCAYTQTEPSANDWEENPGSITTAKSIYAVDETHPDFAQSEGLYHVFGAEPVDLWRMYCEVMKSDVENGSFENSALLGKMDPMQSCMNTDLLPPWFVDEYSSGLSTTFPKIRWTYNASQNDKEDASFNVPAGWNKVAGLSRSQQIEAGNVISVTLKVANIGNWAKLDFVLVSRPDGTGWTQLGENSVICDGQYHTYQWVAPAWMKNTGYSWAYLVVNSSLGGQVEVQSIRVLQNTATPSTEASSPMTQGQIFPGDNSEWTFGTWGSADFNYSDGVIGSGVKFNFSKANDGVLWYANTPHTNGSFSKLVITYLGGTCKSTAVYFDQNTVANPACTTHSTCLSTDVVDNFAWLGDLDAPKNTVQTFTTSLWNINGNGAFIPVHRLMFHALRAGPVDDCVIQSIQFQ